MKKIELSYHREFPRTPISGWAGVRWCAWVNPNKKNDQWQRPKWDRHPFSNQRKLWCLLKVHFQGIDLVFAIPAELDQFIEVLSQNPLPSGNRLVKGRGIGRPNNHWLARLPKGVTSWSFRQKLCKYLTTAPQIVEFRKFYVSQPVQLEFEGYFDSFYEAAGAQKFKKNS